MRRSAKDASKDTGVKKEEEEQQEESPEPSLNGAAAAHVSLRKRANPGVAKRALAAAGIPPALDWIAPETALHYSEMGNQDKTAQVHPYLFTTSMATLAQEAGVRIIDDATVTAITHDPDPDPSGSTTGIVRSVTYTRKAPHTQPMTLRTTTVILAAGPWTPTLYPSVPMKTLRAHSITIRPSRPVSAFALFTEIELPKNYRGSRRPANRAGAIVTPEIYARPNDEVYACGEGDELSVLPASTDLVKVLPERTQEIVEQVASVSDELRDGQVLVRQACYLPVLKVQGGPLIGWTALAGLLLATGHTCWGIQNGPGTGKLISEFVFEGEARSARIESLDPRRVLAGC